LTHHAAKLIPDHQGRRHAEPGEAGMPTYRVSFMNEIPRNDKLFRCCQRSLIIRSAPSTEWAIEAAKQQFAELEGISDWKIHAALIAVEPVDLQAEPETGPPMPTPRSYARKRARSQI
jgi:hypothetical protein